ncbi:C-terminal binding protein [Dactylosporangium sp. NPDC051485]|uniref:C-terminal binding protein n=1 Tax=Dactylosporangium sp. NPDC051485 TaxID=3154846 RepID=UPI0034337746
MRIVITDCDHATVDIEEQLAAEHGAELVLARCRTAADVIAAGAGADALVVQYAPIDATVLDALPTVRAVSRYGVGVDTVDVDAASARGVAVCNVPGYADEEVAQHAVALALAVERGVLPLDRSVRAGRPDYAAAGPLHRSSERTFGVVGFGAIGRTTARKAAGLGYRVVAHDPRYPSGERLDGVVQLSFDELLAAADVVSLHVPLVPATHHLIDAAALARMRPGAVLVNTCRGGVVDTDALVAALAGGQLAGAALDVVDPEPLPAGHPLLTQPRAVLTPHAAWYSEESVSELKRRVMANAIAVCEGLAPADIVNPEVLARTVRA